MQKIQVSSLYFKGPTLTLVGIKDVSTGNKFITRKDTSIMWRERIIEAKKAKGLSTKMMSERSPSHMPPETIKRILNETTEFPRIDSVLDLGVQVGLSPWELFSETSSRIVDASVSALQEENAALKAEKATLLEENGALKNQVDTLKNKVESLRDKVDTLKDEIIATHNYYIKNK